MDEDEELLVELREGENDCFHCGSPRETCSSREEVAQSQMAAQRRAIAASKTGTQNLEWDAASSAAEPSDMTPQNASMLLDKQQQHHHHSSTPDNDSPDNGDENDAHYTTRFTPVDKFTNDDDDENNYDKPRCHNFQRSASSTKPKLTVTDAEQIDNVDDPNLALRLDSTPQLTSPAPSAALDDGQSVGSDGGGDVDGPPPRLLLVSSKIKNLGAIQSAMLPHVFRITYKHDLAPDDILSLVAQELGSTKVESIAIIAPSTTTSLHVFGKDDKLVITKESILEVASIRGFFEMLAEWLDKSWVNARLDFLHSSAALTVDGNLIADVIKTLIGVPVGISKDINGIPLTRLGEGDAENGDYNDGNDITMTRVGQLYFNLPMLRSWSANQQSLSGFEKIRTVGKGAYGTAVLYRKKDDDSLVILKEINMCDLNANERQMALNEVRVLAMMDHPNIIGYYDTFEEDGTMMIEMEYADGGTLEQFLSSLEDQGPMPEKDILALFSQIVGAIRHMHELKILHRDLKTTNIFMTKEGIIKVGDFGISKMMTTNGASTVLGTPYYISPEICEGKAYNEKSDIWSLGCVLYEMACLQKTFEGTTLPALVNKIMKGQYAPLRGDYSHEFKTLIRDMLQKEPEFRPTATDLLYSRLPELQIPYLDPVTDNEEDMLTASTESMASGLTKKKQMRSELYCIDMGSLWLTGIKLPQRINVRELSSGSGHCVLVSSEHVVFSWGRNHKGQLGVGDLEDRLNPTPVEALRGKTVVRGVCGSNFSAFISDNGIVMTCGDGTTGCLGHGDWNCITKPKLIEALLSVDVNALACGPQHVAVVGSKGEVFTWGIGAKGRLGHGSEDDKPLPNRITIDEPVLIKDVFCGTDGTMFLTDAGGVLACGSNEHNKLGLNHRQGFLMTLKQIFNQSEVVGAMKPTCVRSLNRHRVIDISMGIKHSAILVDPGTIITLGCNDFAQLGIGNTKQQCYPTVVRGLSSKIMADVYCAQHFTISWTAEELFFWGGKPKSRQGLASSHSAGFEPPTPLPAETNDEPLHLTMNKNFPELKPNYGLERSTSMETSSSSEGSKADSSIWNDPTNVDEKNISTVSQPSLFLTLSALKNENIDETLLLTDVVCLGHFLYILVETTIFTAKEGNPNRRLRTKLNRRMRKRITLPNCAKSPVDDKSPPTQEIHCQTIESSTNTTVPDVAKDENNDEKNDKKDDEKINPNEDTMASVSIPAWIKQELATSEDIPVPQNEYSNPIIEAPQPPSTTTTAAAKGGQVHLINITDNADHECETKVEVINDGTVIEDVEGNEPLGDNHDDGPVSQLPSIYPDGVASGGGAMSADGKRGFADPLLHSVDILSSSSGSEVGTVLKGNNINKEHARPKIAFGTEKAFSQNTSHLPNINDGNSQRVDSMIEIYGGGSGSGGGTSSGKPGGKKSTSSRPTVRQPSTEKISKSHTKSKSRGSASKPLPTRDGCDSRGGSSKMQPSSSSSTRQHIDESPSRKIYQEVQERLSRLELENKEMREYLKRIETSHQEKEKSQVSAERGLQDEVVGLRNDLKEALAFNFRQLQTDLEDQMRRFQVEQRRRGAGVRAAYPAESPVSDSSVSGGDRPLTKESGYGTAKRKRAVGNRVEPQQLHKIEKSKICSIS